MKRILKRSFVLIIAFIFVFSISVPCFASDTEHGGGGGFRWDWTDEEKLEYYKYKGQKIIHELTGIGRDNIAEDFLDRLYPYWDVRGYATFEEYLLHELGYDEEQEVFVPSQNLTVDINNCIQEYNDSVTMTYRYPVQVQNLGADTFPNNTVYQALLDLCLAYPDCYVFTTNEYRGNHRGEPYMDLQGNAKELPYDSSSDNFYLFNVIPAPFAGVTQYTDLYSASVSFYNDNWEMSFEPKNFWFTTDGRVFTYCNESLKVGSTNYSAYFKQIEPGTFPDLSTLGSMYYWSWYGTSYAMFLDNKHGASLSARTVYSANVGALNVYKSEADMKKDIGSQVIGSYSSNYTGSCVPSVDVNVINNYEIPGSGGDSGSGGGSGSDDNGGGSVGIFDTIASGVGSLFKGLASIVGAIVNGFASIIEAIVSPIERIINTIVDLFKQFIDTIVSFTEMYDENIPLFFQSLFSFLPSGLVTVMTSSFVLIIIVAVIKFLRG